MNNNAFNDIDGSNRCYARNGPLSEDCGRGLLEKRYYTGNVQSERK